MEQQNIPPKEISALRIKLRAGRQGDCPESGGQAAMAISEGVAPTGSKRWPKPEPSVPL
jgi:hypothetical protein